MMVVETPVPAAPASAAAVVPVPAVVPPPPPDAPPPPPPPPPRPPPPPPPPQAQATWPTLSSATSVRATSDAEWRPRVLVHVVLVMTSSPSRIGK
ncbi:MAG: hypothetical protein EHM42_13575 [Planctomycetaceae bacterium]|nr:MAG: hypothetical protein EHM42_13575 [Planctomycetaceae bacterium]